MLGVAGKKQQTSYMAYIAVAMAVSCYLFPFGLTFLPSGLNSKIGLAVVAFPLLGLHILNTSRIQLDRDFLPALIFAVIFSLVGFVSVDLNQSADLSYANYWISFATWMLSAYTIIWLIKRVHHRADIELIINYLAAVCVTQCFLALAIDNIPALKLWIDAYISQEAVASAEFLNKVDRLYGIGAALDPAGTRFSIVLLGLAAVIVRFVNSGKRNNSILTWYWLAFVIICVLGNMIARTTTVGMGMGLIYIFFGTRVLSTQISARALNFLKVCVTVTLVLIVLAVYFYNTDNQVREQLRFAFEGFFSWVETGVWRTDSTDKLNNEMWVWPTDLKTWIIGKADFTFGGTGTDIGYCRFIFYSGIAGLSVFSLFFIYNAFANFYKFPEYKALFIFLPLLGFVVWLKIPTDIFTIYALFYCLDKPQSVPKPVLSHE